MSNRLHRHLFTMLFCSLIPLTLLVTIKLFGYWGCHIFDNYRSQTKFAMVMISHVSVSPQGGLSLCPGGSPSRGYFSGGLCPGGSLSRYSLVQIGGSLSMGIPVQGGLCSGGSLSGDRDIPSYDNEQVERTLLECILVASNVTCTVSVL